MAWAQIDFIGRLLSADKGDVSVTVDHQPLAAADLGLETVGEVFSHLARENRLVVHFLIDGEPPNLDELPAVKQESLDGHTVYIETADPRDMARQVLADAESDLAGADAARDQAADLLRRNEFPGAMEKLAACLSAWQGAQQALVGTARLLKMDVQAVLASADLPADWLDIFTGQLRELAGALQARDGVTLTDLLAYETTHTTSHWQAALAAIRRSV